LRAVEDFTGRNDDADLGLARRLRALLGADHAQVVFEERGLVRLAELRVARLRLVLGGVVIVTADELDHAAFDVQRRLDAGDELRVERDLGRVALCRE
jgi:hypothetical protein